jgi:hypothetical protein
MSTPEEDAQQKAEEVARQKEVEFYAASVNAWYTTSLEYDKSMFTLSAGGIGLLITLLTAVGVSSSAFLHLYIVAIFFFLMCLCLLLVVFRRNRDYITKVVQGQDDPDPLLKILDVGAMIMFGLGVVLTVVIGVSAAVQTFNKGKDNDSRKEGATTSQGEHGKR